MPFHEHERALQIVLCPLVIFLLLENVCEKMVDFDEDLVVGDFVFLVLLLEDQQVLLRLVVLVELFVHDGEV